MTLALAARALRISLSTSSLRTLVQPSRLFVTLGFYLAVTSVLSTLWRTATQSNGGSIVGYTAVALTWYVATSEAVTVSLNTRLIEDVGEEIASGAVAVELLRPMSVVAVRVAAELGRCLPRVAACAVTGVVFCRLVGGAPPNAVALLLAAPSMVLAVAINIVSQHAFAAVSFWIRDSRSTWFLYQKLVFVVGGMLLPLQVLPDPIFRVAMVLPFMAMAYAPARLASGHLEPWLLLVQVAWLAALSVAAALVFARGERRLQVVGG
jgi:ABC-2 type transport system permease protein